MKCTIQVLNMLATLFPEMTVKEFIELNNKYNS